MSHELKYDPPGTLGPHNVPNSRLLAPIHLARSQEPCWQCRRPAEVFCLRSAGILDVEVDNRDIFEETYDEPAWISNLEEVAPAIESRLRTLAPRYSMDFSRTQSAQVRMNHCPHCGAKMGDFYLHNEPGGAFFPTTAEEEARISLQLLAPDGEFEFVGSFGLRG